MIVKASQGSRHGTTPRVRIPVLLPICIVCILLCCRQSTGFVQGSFERRNTSFLLQPFRISRISASLKVDDNDGDNSTSSDELQINKGLAKAKLLIEKSKAKLKAQDESKEQCDTSSTLPFFAKLSVDRKSVVKAVDEKTGLITADGDAMAAISEQEEWEVRPLYEVFKSEVGEKEDVYSIASQQLAQRDVAASIWNLRKNLQKEDYQRIFDKRNRFIGEDV